MSPEDAVNSYSKSPKSTLECMQTVWKDSNGNHSYEWMYLRARMMFDSGMFTDAVNWLDQTVIPQYPNHAEAYFLVAIIYRKKMNDCARAMPWLRRTVEFEVDSPEPYFHLAFCLKAAGNIPESMKWYSKCIDHKPLLVPCAHNLGRSLYSVGKYEEALASLEMARNASAEADAELLSDLGLAYAALNSFERARLEYEEALKKSPNHLFSLVNLGNMLVHMGNQYRDEAVRVYSRAVEHHPETPETHYNLGRVLKSLNRVDEALACFKTALKLRPNFNEALTSLVHSLYWLCEWRELEQRWPDLQPLIALEQSSTPPMAITPFQAMAYPISAMNMLKIAQAHAGMLEKRVHTSYERHNSGRRGGDVRIGYMSYDIGGHPLSYLLRNVFAMHKVETHLFSTRDDDGSDDYTYISRSVDFFNDVSRASDAEIAKMIASKDIDILVDLSGWTKGGRMNVLIHLKRMGSMPLIANYMGFCGSTGAPWTDYIVTDRVTSPPYFSHHYSENYLYMPHSYFANDYRQSWDHIPHTERHDNETFTFCNFNQLYKLDRSTFAMWLSILRSVPGSKMWLLRFPEGSELQLMAEAGDIADRFVFSDTTSREEHMNRIGRCDLFLDMCNVNAHTGATDVLWAGVPLLTLPGIKMASRVAASCVAVMGLAEWLVVGSSQDYIDRAIKLANDRQLLMQLRERVENGRDGPLFDTAKWTSDVEKGYRMSVETGGKMHVVLS